MGCSIISSPSPPRRRVGETAFGMDETQAEVMLMRLAISGFINYESYRKTAIIKEKIYDYIKANIKKQDYDNIRFVSSTKKGANAILNIFDMDLRMY